MLHRSAAQMGSRCGPAHSWPCSGFAVIESPSVSFNLETTVISQRGLILGVNLISPDGFLSPCGRLERLIRLRFDFFQVDYMRVMCPCHPLPNESVFSPAWPLFPQESQGTLWLSRCPHTDKVPPPWFQSTSVGSLLQCGEAPFSTCFPEEWPLVAPHALTCPVGQDVTFLKPGCYNESHRWEASTTDFYFCCFWGQEVPDQGASQLGVCEGPSPWHADDCHVLM